MTDETALELKFLGALVEQLGAQMYPIRSILDRPEPIRAWRRPRETVTMIDQPPCCRTLARPTPKPPERRLAP